MVEVVIAVGIFAVAVVSILGLLPALVRPAGESADLLAAQRLAGPVEIELGRLAASNFDALVAAVPVMSEPLQNGFSLVGARDGLRLRSLNNGFAAGSPELAQGEQYFFVEVWQFPQPDLRYDGASGLLAVHVRVSWPYYNPGVLAPIPLVDRSQVTFTVSLIR